MRLLKIILIISSIIVFISCAKVSHAPGDESNEAKSFQIPEGRGSVYLYRTGRMVGAAGQLYVKINGMDAGGTGPGSFFRWDLKPGTYTFLSSTDESSATVKLDVKEGESYFIRQDARLGVSSGRVTMKQVDAEQGIKEVKNCKLLVSSYVPE